MEVVLAVALAVVRVPTKTEMQFSS